jgi:hypothetical protein
VYAEQVLPAQHGCPEPPQDSQYPDPELHTVYAEQVLPAQHGCPEPPQDSQYPDPELHKVLGAEQVLPAQHVPLSSPQQVPFSQEPPAEQVLPAQHGSPEPPHISQVPHPQESKLHEHTVFAAPQVCPEQQVPLNWPQQVPPSQMPSPGHASPEEQHGCPDRPHAVQVPDVH